MKVTIPDSYFCDVCNSPIDSLFNIQKYNLYKTTGAGRYDNIKVMELDVCSSCEPSNAFFNCAKKQTLLKKIISFMFKNGN